MIPEGPRLTQKVISVENLSHSISGEKEDKKILYDNLNFLVERGDRLGIVGGNGTGIFNILSSQ